jgi:hypothetical protein
MEAGVAKVEAHVEAAPEENLKNFESSRGWRHFP